jgi:hypothetical protein
MSANIKCVRLVTGEDIICDLVENTDSYTFNNPVQLGMVPSQTTGQPTFGFVPFPVYGKDKKDFSMEISKRHVVFVTEAVDEFITQYRSMNSGIVTPSQGLIV